MELYAVKPSPKADKKWRAVFIEDGKKRHTDFGAKGMDDYTLTHNKEQRRQYRERHRKDLRTGDPTKAGYLSYYLLWGKHTSLRKNIQEYKNRFYL
jgi:hypothetical protein